MANREMEDTDGREPPSIDEQKQTRQENARFLTQNIPDLEPDLAEHLMNQFPVDPHPPVSPPKEGPHQTVPPLPEIHTPITREQLTQRGREGDAEMARIEEEVRERQRQEQERQRQEELRAQELAEAKRLAEEARQQAETLRIQMEETERKRAAEDTIRQQELQAQQQETQRQLQEMQEALRQQQAQAAEQRRLDEERRGSEERARQAEDARRQQREAQLLEQVNSALNEVEEARREAEEARLTGGSRIDRGASSNRRLNPEWNRAQLEAEVERRIRGYEVEPGGVNMEVVNFWEREFAWLREDSRLPLNEIRAARDQFMARLLLTASDVALFSGDGDTYWEVGKVFYREGGREGVRLADALWKIPGFAQGVTAIEDKNGAQFRSKNPLAELARDISTAVPRGQNERVASIILKFYNFSGAVARYTGPLLLEGNDQRSKGQPVKDSQGKELLVEDVIRKKVFTESRKGSEPQEGLIDRGIRTLQHGVGRDVLGELSPKPKETMAVDLGKGEYWDWWTRILWEGNPKDGSSLKLSGEPYDTVPLLVFKNMSTPFFLDVLQVGVSSRLRRIFDSRLRDLPSFCGVDKVSDWYKDRQKYANKFYGWFAMYKGSNTFVDKLISEEPQLLSQPLTDDASNAFGEPKQIIENVDKSLEPFIKIIPALNYVYRYDTAHPKEKQYEMTALLLGYILGYFVNSDEGQEALLFNRRHLGGRPWEEAQMFAAVDFIKSKRGFDQVWVDRLLQQLGASRASLEESVVGKEVGDRVGGAIKSFFGWS